VRLYQYAFSSQTLECWLKTMKFTIFLCGGLDRSPTFHPRSRSVATSRGCVLAPCASSFDEIVINSKGEPRREISVSIMI
jgi:hypothetical protein